MVVLILFPEFSDFLVERFAPARMKKCFRKPKLYVVLGQNMTGEDMREM